MQRIVYFLAILISANATAQISDFIHIDQFGYTENSTKIAILSNPQKGYNSALSYSPSAIIEVRKKSDNTVVYTDSLNAWNEGNTHSQSGNQGWWFDFSSLTAAGEYYIIDVANNQRSGDFAISDYIYAGILKAAGRMFYYNRCNIAKLSQYAGNWADANSFLNPLQDANCRFIYDSSNTALEKELSGGWFDAGDYNKYVSFTNSTLHNLLSAYEENPSAFSDSWNIPESGNGVPDILDEIKWELDWLIKMTNADGSVHIKQGSQNYSDNISSPPSANSKQRFYGPTCSSASIIVASVFSHASKVFNTIPTRITYAKQLQQIAINCFDYSRPYVDKNTYETNCDDGRIVSGDSDLGSNQQLSAFVTAAIYLYEQTGDTLYNNYVIANVPSMEQLKPYWSAYYIQDNDALLLYAQLASADVTTANSIISSLTQDISTNYNDYYGLSSSDLYRANMPSWSYHWGSNQTKASYGNLNNIVIASNTQIDTSDYHEYVDGAIHYFHGVNPQNLVYLSNMYAFGAEKSVNEIYHMWFADGTDYDHAQTSTIGCAPGYVSGGANKDFSISTMIPPYGQPDQKSYLDYNTGWPDNSWEISEPAIYYQAAYVRLLANRVVLDQNTADIIDEKVRNLDVYPNPVDEYLRINSDEQINSVLIYSIDGKQILNINQSVQIVNVSMLTSGVYYILINHKYHKKIIKK
ncbi:MAG: glycoside hydrolase family 9 protein [Bacteroidetes bacterium]|nr:glycoside hydrolase family 9 protein [Bacteroidota bacterium]